MSENIAPAVGRPPLSMTAEQAALRTYSWVASLPENKGFTPEQLRIPARAMLTRMIETGLFVITNRNGN
jgi:hypothetical protein